MPLRFTLVCTLLLSSGLGAKTINDIDTESVNWLLTQINIGEAQQNKKLIDDSLQKLVAIAPNRIETKCALVHYSFMNGDIQKANLALSKLDNRLTKQIPCVKKLKVLSNVNGKDKAEIQRAKLLARAGQYKQAQKIYSAIFTNIYPTLDYELEHLSWFAQDDEQWQAVKNSYEKLLKSHPNLGLIEIAYARHMLRRNPSDNRALYILEKYGVMSRFSDEVESIWLAALKDMPLEDATDEQFQHYFTFYPFSDKGELQYQDFKKKLKTRQTLLADPAYQLWIKGDKLLEKNKLETAEPLLLEALKARPEDSKIMRSLGILYLRLGNNLKSYNYFTEAQNYTSNFEEREQLRGLAKTARFWLYIGQAREAINKNDFKTATLKLNLADKLEEDPKTVLYNRGLIKFSQGEYSQASAIYQVVLKNDPLNESALFGLLEIAELEQNENALNSFFNQLVFAQREVIRESYLASLSSIYRKNANTLAEKGDLDKAEKILKDAIQMAPDQPWLYYDLAFIYQQKGLVKEARTLFNNVLWRFPLNTQLRYSHALFLRAIDDYNGALNTLQFIPFKARNADIMALEQQLQLNEYLTQSQQYLNSNDRANAIYHLSALEAQNLTPVMKAELSLNWYQIDEQKYAIKLIKSALNDEPSLSPYWHLLYGEWLLAQSDDQKVKQWFTNYTLPENASESDINQYMQLQNIYLSRYYSGSNLIAKLNQLDQKYKSPPAITTALINANLALGQHQAAVIFYEQKVKNNKMVEPQALIAIAQAYRKIGDDHKAKEITQQAINLSNTQESYFQRQIMLSLNDFNYSGDAVYLAQQLIEKSPNDAELRYLGAQVASNFNEAEQAKIWYTDTITSNQTLDAKELYSSLSKINESDEWYINNAKRELLRQQNKNQAYVAVGINFSGQTSTESEATLGAGLVPIEAYFPLWQGQGFVKIDPTNISAQTTRFDEQFAGSRYGQGALCIFTCGIEEVTPEQSGVDIGIGWQNENWRMDIGTTPLGFLIEDIVWGINYSDDFGDFGYSLEFEKRPITSSVLSYAGLEDVNTGKLWGGVRSTGFTANISHDLGGDWGFWSSADFTLYKGQNVKDNQRYRLMGGTYYRVISNQERVFTAGASLLHWAYKFNLSEETWGHGGYYSPQNYIGLSAPLTYDARWGDDFVYRIRTGLSYSQTKTQAIDFFPNDPELQAEAFVRQLETGVDPAFNSDTSAGVSYNLEGSFEYRITPHWFFGGYLAIDRSDFYEPNFGQLYIRYYFNPVYGTLEFPGTPIIPYADF